MGIPYSPEIDTLMGVLIPPLVNLPSAGSAHRLFWDRYLQGGCEGCLWGKSEASTVSRTKYLSICALTRIRLTRKARWWRVSCQASGVRYELKFKLPPKREYSNIMINKHVEIQLKNPSFQPCMLHVTMATTLTALKPSFLISKMGIIQTLQGCHND